MLCRTGVLCTIFAFVILIPSVMETAVGGQERPPTSPGAELPLRQNEEINETYELAPGAHVEISVISGPVEIETTNSSRAEVRILRSGPKRETADCYTVAISHSPSRLIL